MKAAIVVPWRGGDTRREEIWAYTRRWWDRLGYPIFQVEHAGTDPFSRGWCLNEGARRAYPWDVLVMIDADVVCEDEGQVIKAIGAAWDTGKFTMAHTEGRDLNERGTLNVLRGRDIDWLKHTESVRPGCLSRVNMVRADMFETLGGFDERFKGWGHEDVAFNAASEKLAGDYARVEGITWHLRHSPMLAQARRTREWNEGRQLAARYLEARRWSDVQNILNERTDSQRYISPDSVDAPEPIVGAETELAVLTCGRKDELAATLESFEANVIGKVTKRTMFDDSGDAEHLAWLQAEYGDRFEVISWGANLGFSKAMVKAREHIAQHDGPEYVFWLEDDFIFRRTVEIDDMATLLSEGSLAQVALLRAPYYPREFEAGSIPNEHPESYTQATYNGIRYLRHDRFYTSNPNLSTRSLFRDYPWPAANAHTESRYGRGLVKRGLRFAFLGDGEPWIDHVGTTRAGHGY